MVNSQLGMVLRHLCDLTTATGTEGPSDTELLRRFCARREETAFAALMQRHGRMVWGVCRDVLRHEQDAEDAFQATFLALARQAGSIRKGEAVACWLHGTARRIALAARRAREARRVHERQARSMPPEKPLSEEALREALGMLDDEVQALPERQRAVFVLCCLEGKSRTEAAHALGWKEGTVASTLARARQLLQQRLARRGVTLTSALCAVVLVRQAPAAAPAILARSTVRAALSYTAGNGLPDTVSPMVVELAKGATTTMMTTKLKAVLVVLLALGLGVVLLALGLGAAGISALAPRAEPSQRPAKQPAAQARARPAAAQDKAAQSREVSGLVVGPDNKPFAGAKLFVVTRGAKKADLKVKATTGDDGRFRLRVSRADLERDARLLATAAGHGPDWVLGQPGGGWPDKVRLRLVKEVPISGRLLDGEGQPLAGIDLRVLSVEKGTNGRDPTPRITLPGTDGGMPVNSLINSKPETIRISPAALGLPGSVKTGKDGSFRLGGVGRGRLVRLALRAPHREHADLCVTTSFDRVDSAVAPWGLYGHTFKHLVLPSRPIVGSVRDKRTGKPLAGIAVMAQAAMPVLRTRFNGDVIGIPARASTDDKGRFRIDGIGKHDFYHVHAGGSPYTYLRPVSPLPPGGPYFGQDKLNVKDTAGLEPLTVDFELDRGVLLRGRLTDQVTGKPVQGLVGSVPLADNPNRKLFAVVQNYVQTAADGSFSLVAVPGPGLLWVSTYLKDILFLTADEKDRYARMHGRYDDSLARDMAALYRSYVTPAMYHAVVRINPKAKDAETTVGAISLEPGQTRSVNVVGPDGKPLKGVLPFGLSAVEGDDRGQSPSTTASFQALGLSKRTPRPLLFIHPQRRLSKQEWVKADGGKPLTVRLEPPGTVTGRVVDPTGRRLAGVEIYLSGFDVVLNKDIPHGALRSVLGGDRPLKTDADGKFRFEGVYPGVKYRLATYPGAPGRPVTIATGVSVESGKVKNLGDLKRKEAPKGEKEKEQ
jgi:RNA polymerase sigma factor (sigma-70 family)